MLFNSGEFLVFFPCVLALYYLVPKKLKNLCLLAASYCFYMNWSRRYALLLLFSTLMTYLCGLGVGAARSKGKAGMAKVILIIDLLINLGILFVFKYFNFVFSSAEVMMDALGIAKELPRINVYLPVGISFYTFQALGYTIDVYRGEIEAEKDFVLYALFVSFFPQLVAGPIERSHNLLTQMKVHHRFSYERAKDGVLLMIWGYFLKIVLADRAAIFVDAVYGDIAAYGGWYLIAASVLFAFQIYCDFAGYSIIAKGAARILGIDLMENFNAPYLALSVSDFWRRWHISLSGWFRDYLYIPLGGNRKGKMRKYLNLMIVFIVSGLWHGANWTFVVWGALNGLWQVIGSLGAGLKKRAAKIMRLDVNAGLCRWLQRLCTFVLIDLTWVFFRAGSLRESLQILQSMASADNFHVLFDGSLMALGLSAPAMIVLLLSIALLMAADILKERGVVVRKWILSRGFIVKMLAVSVSVFLILTFGIWGSEFSEAGFIYFQF